MKKTNSMRVAAAMLALTLITSCFVGGTFAKYTTSGWGGKSARVAKFGVEIENPGDLFKANYDTTDKSAKFEGDFSVSSENGKDKVVAPGTSGEATLISITGKPEVAVRINATLNSNNKLKMIYHRMWGAIGFGDPTIDDWGQHGVTVENDTSAGDTSTEAGASGADDVNYYRIDTVNGYYYPIVWTLKKDGETVCVGNLAYINQYFESLSGDYAPNTDLSEIFGTYTLAWEWKFELLQGDYLGNYEDYMWADQQYQMNYYDTELGDLMAEGAKSDPGQYSLEEEFNLYVTVTQID